MQSVLAEDPAEFLLSDEDIIGKFDPGGYSEPLDSPMNRDTHEEGEEEGSMGGGDLSEDQMLQYLLLQLIG